MSEINCPECGSMNCMSVYTDVYARKDEMLCCDCGEYFDLLWWNEEGQVPATVDGRPVKEVEVMP